MADAPDVAMGSSRACAKPQSYIYEYPHPPLVTVPDHTPGSNEPLTFFESAVDKGVSGLELHLRWLDGYIVSAHDAGDRHPNSAKMECVMKFLTQRLGDPSGTVHQDGLQFFVVLEIMEPHDFQDHYEDLIKLLDRYRSYLSTAVGERDTARGLSVVLTGGTDAFYGKYLPGINQLAIKEGPLYQADGIANLSPGARPFEWRIFGNPNQVGQINKCHLEHTNVRVYYGGDGLDDSAIREIMASGTDAQNTRVLDMELTLHAMQDQRPEGTFPALAASGDTALVTWKSHSNYLYASIGAMGPAKLSFTRQLNLNAFLPGRAYANITAAALSPDKTTLVIIYSYPDTVSYVAGRFTSRDRFLTFAGVKRTLECGGKTCTGGHPMVALGPNSRVIVAYEGGPENPLNYACGTIASDGTLNMLAPRRLEDLESYAYGYGPAVAFDAAGSVVIVYVSANHHSVRYVAAVIDPNSGKLNPKAGDVLPGENPGSLSRPSIAIKDDFVAVTYGEMNSTRLWYVTGRFVPYQIQSAHRFSLSAGDRNGKPTEAMGHRPTVALCDGSGGAVLYEAPEGGQMRYVVGMWDEGRLVGEERVLNMALGES